MVRRWEILLWLFLAVVLAVVLSWLLLNRDEPLPAAPPTVNPHARLAASGSPLPADAGEDVVVEQQQLDGHVFSLHYDADNGNWQLDFFAEGRPFNVRYLADSQMFLVFDVEGLLWHEIGAESLGDEVQALADVERYLLTASQLDGFNSRAVESPSVNCRQQPTALCAVWQAHSLWRYEEVVIQVNKKTRKIDHIVLINPLDLAAGSITADYDYRPITIELPPADDVRYLSDDD